MFRLVLFIWIPLVSSFVNPYHHGIVPGRRLETTIRPLLPSFSSRVGKASTTNDWVGQLPQPKADLSSASTKLALTYRAMRFAILRRRVHLRKQMFGTKRKDDPASKSKRARTVGGGGPAAETATSSMAVPTISFEETPMRSAVKSLPWRLLAGSVTLWTSYRFSGGSLVQAMSIVSSDFLSKVVTMFIGERLFNRHSAGRIANQESAKRSLIKALIWRLFAIVNTLTVAVLVSKDFSVASQIAGSDAIVKTAVMFAYERVWTTIRWGQTNGRTMQPAQCAS
jgi:uncharacterized membrane protein